MTAGRHRRPRPPRRRRTVLVIAGIAVTTAGLGGVAAAYWPGTGGGTGTADTGTVTAVTLTPGDAAATLSPGHQGAVVLTVSNPNVAAVFVGSLALDGSRGTNGFAVDAGHSGCATSVLSYTTQTNAGAGWTVAGGNGAVDGTLPITLPDALTMDVGAANACQGAVFTVYLMVGA